MQTLFGRAAKGSLCDAVCDALAGIHTLQLVCKTVDSFVLEKSLLYTNKKIGFSVIAPVYQPSLRGCFRRPAEKV